MASATPAIPQRVYPTGMLVALCGILMFFAALISAWVVRHGFAEAGAETPLEFPRLLLEMNACVLIVSSATLRIARWRFMAGRREAFRGWWSASLGLGILFLAGQSAVWWRLRGTGVFLRSNPDASFFFLLSGAHALHVLGGIAGLVAVGYRPLRRVELGSGVRICVMYWHFLAAMWIAILVLLLGTSQ